MSAALRDSQGAFWLWGARELVHHGLPARVFSFLGGIGDDVMATCVLRELHLRGARRNWMLTHHPELYVCNSNCSHALSDSAWAMRLLNLLRVTPETFYYVEHRESEDRDIPPDRHLLEVMCAKAGIRGRIELRPEVFLTSAERQAHRPAKEQIAFQTSGQGARFAMRTKEWLPERFHRVADRLRDRFLLVQIGALADPPLAGALDLRGKLSLRETAAVLANSRLFVGLVGGLMHLARAVDCPAVIVYGGRETPAQSGYSCNENVVHQPNCSPCWQWNHCDRDYLCMTSITVEDVLGGVTRQLARPRTELAVQTADLA